jgi:lipoate-protein ligase A
MASADIPSPGREPANTSKVRKLMQFLDLTLPTLAENLALDEALVLEREAGQRGEVLRVWEWPTYAVVLGAGCALSQDIDEESCREDGVPILRRGSGGGTVLLGAGSLCYSLVLGYERSPALREIRPSYRYILETTKIALTDVLAGIQVAGTSDLAAGNLKFSGNAQQRKRNYVLHHGTLLYAFDLAVVSRYLRPPVRQPEYRAGREHRAFLRNLPIATEHLRACLRSAWQATSDLQIWPRKLTAELVEQKYAQSQWVRRR